MSYIVTVKRPSSVRPSVCLFVRLSVRPSTFHINRFFSHSYQPISFPFIFSDSPT